MKLTLRKPSKALALAARPAILPGYRPWDVAGFLSRHKRLFLTALFVFTFFYSALFLMVPRALTVPFSIPIVVVYLLVVWALPVRDYAPMRALTGLFWAYFVTLLIWPNYLAISIPGLPWITMARLFGGPLIVLMLIHVSNCGPYREEMKAMLAESRTLVTLVAVFSVLMLISTAFSNVPFDTLNRVINAEIVWGGMFFASIWAFRRPKVVHAWVVVYVVLTAVICAIAILEARKGGVLWAEHIPSFLKVEDESVQRILAGAYRLGSIYRVISTSTTPLSLAELLGASTALLLYAFLEYRNIFVRIALLALDALIVYVIVLTDARLGFVSFIIGHVCYLLYYTYRVRKFQPTSLFGMSLTMMYPLAFAAVISSVLFVGRIRNSVIGNGRNQPSNNARMEQFDLAMSKIWQSPLFGFGSGRGGPKVGFTNPAGTLTIDSYYLSILMDYGFIGFFVFYGMLIVAIKRGLSIGLRDLSRESHLAVALSIFLIIFIVAKAVLSQELNHPLIFIAMGGIVALSYSAKGNRLIPGKTPV